MAQKFRRLPFWRCPAKVGTPHPITAVQQPASYRQSFITGPTRHNFGNNVKMTCKKHYTIISSESKYIKDRVLAKL